MPSPYWANFQIYPDQAFCFSRLTGPLGRWMRWLFVNPRQSKRIQRGTSSDQVIYRLNALRDHALWGTEMVSPDRLVGSQAVG